MRRRLLPKMPALTRFYPGLKPWDWEHMTANEVDAHLMYMDAFIAAQERQARGGRRA